MHSPAMTRIAMPVRAVVLALFAGLLALLALTGCDRDSQGSNASGPTPVRELVFYSWEDDLPPSLLTAFTAETGVRVVYRTYRSMEEAVASIRSGQACDVAVIENPFIPDLAAEGLLAELDHRNIPNLVHLAEDFRELLFDPGNHYSVTFNWGLTGLVVRDDLARGRVTRWADLWDEQFAGRVQIWDLQRTLVGIALKSLGYSANSEHPDELEAALARLVQLKARARTSGYAPDLAEQALVDGRTILLYGYSQDLLRGRNHGFQVSFVIPAEGAIQWTDNFVVPAASPNKHLAERFIDFMLRPEISARIVNEQHYPTASKAATPFIRPEILNDPVLFPPVREMRRAEVLMPLSLEGQRLHAQLWRRYLAAPALSAEH